MTRRPQGVFVAITTPFDVATGEVAPVALRGNARALLEAGVDGLVAAGTTGEAPLLEPEEYRKVIGWLRDVVPDDRWLVAGAARESTRATIAACRAATEEGADAVLVRAPAYFGPALAPPALAEHFRRVADGSPIPVLLYNIPKYTHLALSDSLLRSLSDHPNIVGAKDSSGDLKNFAGYRDAVPSWALFVGNGGLFYAALETEAAGGILAVACYAPATAVRVAQAFAHKDRTGAGRAQEQLTAVNRDIHDAFGIAGVKVAMDIVGLAGGPVRPPLQNLARRDRARIAEVLRGAGLLREAAEPAPR